MKFQVHIIKVRNLNESGTNKNDLITEALDVQRKTHVKKKHNFGFIHCWPIVKDHPKIFDIEKITTLNL